MGKFKKIKSCEWCSLLAVCKKLNFMACENGERLETLILPIMPRGFKMRITRVVDK